MHSDYIELRARSAFSFLEGASTPEDLAARAAELGYRAMALGDRDGLYGAPRFYLAAKSAGIRQIVGAELTLDDDSRLYVLAPDRKRYRNLCRMITDSKMRVLNPGSPARDGSPAAPVYPAKGESRITLEELERYGHGLICLAGGVMSPLSRKLSTPARSASIASSRRWRASRESRLSRPTTYATPVRIAGCSTC
jgi:error-prone DNA polymerase